MRILVARCTITYDGRLTTTLDTGDRVIMCKPDGAVVIHSGAAGAKPVNYMPGPTVVTEDEGTLLVHRPETGERLTIELEHVHADVQHALEDEARLQRHGSEKQLQEQIFASPDAVEAIEPGLVAIERERFTDVGPVDLFCRDAQGRTVVVEVKRVRATAPAVEQLTRYVEQVDRNPGHAPARGILLAPELAPQARVMLEDRGFEWADLAPVLEACGAAELDLSLF